MSGRTIKAGADSRKRRVLELVAEGRLNAEEAAALLRVGKDPAPAAAPEEPLAIAVTGMAARFADADGVDAFWDMLRDGRSAISELPEHRRGAETTGRRPKAGFVPDPEAFDAGFFRISPTEAALMDPQQRLFLEQAYHALEDAGLGGEALSEARCGVYVGAGGGDYSEILKARGVSGNPLALMGNVPSILSARISYFLNLKGPSLAVDTACSSSLTALHLAVEALRAGTVDVALAGGVCVINTPEFMSAMAEGGMLSPSDACHTFDAAADGFVCGEGAAAVVLKTLDRALADGDVIHGVIRASGTNQDGRTNGITAPSGTAQQALEEEVYRRHGIDPRRISYVETHGTGTPLGDPIEVDALTGAFRAFTADTGFCRIGSVKTNIGHTLTAAGVAGLVKVLLMMRHRAIAASLNFAAPNPRIDFQASPFRVATALEPWEAQPRIAALSSFGFSGTNAHVVVEEPPAGPSRETVAGAWPVLLSARTKAALAAQAGRLRNWIAAHGDVEVCDVALTLGVGRGMFAARAGFVAGDRTALLDGLAAIAEGRPVETSDPTVRTFVEAGDLPERAAFDPQARRLALPGYPFERRRPGEAPAASPVEAPVADAEALRRHGAAFGLAEEWGRRAMISVLAEMGLFATDRAAFTRAWARRHLGVVDGRARLFDALVNIAARAGVLSVEGDLIRPGPAPETLDRAASRLALLQENPDAAPFLNLLGATLDGLAAVLTGRRTAMEVLFPGGKGDLVEAVYRGNPLAEDLNVRLARRLSEIAGQGTGPLRLLEVGGGTGGATRATLGALATCGRKVRYVFTDVARAFVDAAPRALAPAAGTVDFTALVFDVEGAVPPAVAALGPFDVVIASNVLHATKRIDRTLDRLHEVMAPGGTLLANEVVTVQDFATLTFGLTDGWWAFEDAGTRLADAPVLSVAGWRAALAAAGFPTLAADAITGPDGMEVQAILSAARDTAAVRLQAPAVLPETPAAAPVRPMEWAPAGALEDHLRAIVAQVLTLPVEDVDRRGRFMDLGLDSILGVALVERLNGDLGVDLRPTVVFDHPTVADLAAHLAAEGASLSAPAPAPAKPIAAPMPTQTPGAHDDRIAVIGLSARFADSPDLDGFRAMLRQGRNAIIEVPKARWTPDPDETGQPNPFERWGGFLADAEGFDPLAMRISGKEAELTDPQHRVFLMEAWRALEDAGYGEAALDGLRCGVFVGAHGGDYTHRMTLAGVEPEAFAFMGNAASILAARISYMLNLKGPALAIDTACSSSLVAVHAACRSILDGDCDMALAGGVFVTTVKGFNVAAGKAGMLSPNGRCATFDASADGFVPGEGAGAVLLKPLSQALADGDNIQAVILGSGVNQDGKTNGITAPSPESQADLHRSVYRRHAIDPATIGYVEAHGTGTPLGDPIEIEGLSRAWADWTDARGICAIGSVKTNVGHAAHAAGIGGFVKAVLAVRDGEIHPSLHYRKENPRLRLSDSPFRVPTSLEPWRPADGAPRRAAVSSFGFSGTNCHIVVEQPPERAAVAEMPGPHLFLLSAKTGTALAAKRAQLADHLQAHPLSLDDVARTLAVGRTHFERRFAVVANSREAFIAALRGDGEPGPSGNAGLDGLARTYRAGEDIDLAAVAPSGRRVSLPTYPFELTPYWIAVEAGEAVPPPAAPSPTPPVTLLAARWMPAEQAVEQASGRLLVIGDGTLAASVCDGWARGPATRLAHSAGDEALARASAAADAVVVLASGSERDPAIRDASGSALLAAVRGVLSGDGAAVPILVVHRGAPGDAALVSFGRSIAFFGGRALVRALHLDGGDAGVVLAEIGAGPREVRVSSGARMARHMAPLTPGAETRGLASGASVLITGGGGVLARLLALHLARRFQAAVTLVGRGAESAAIRETIREVEAAGGIARYRVCDVSDSDALGGVIAEAEAAQGPLSAVFHLAGVASDGVVTTKTWDQMRTVLKPKADGLLALDRAVGDRPLEAFVVFTSLAAELGDFGQCDYALANAFADRFAGWRDAEVRAGRRQGRTRAVGWPLWADGKAVMSASGSKLFTEASGLRAIGTEEAFAALDAVLAGDDPAVMVVPGDAAAALRMMEDSMTDPIGQPTQAPAPGPTASGDGAAVAETLTALIAEQMKLPADRLARDANLADFGFDSIALKDFAAAISRRFGIQLSPAVFFAHGSIDALAAHLAEAHGAGGAVAAPTAPAPAIRAVAPAEPAADRAVAVIGLAGRFPGSPDVDAFWANLEAGRDLITDMPAERRDWGLANAGGPGGYIDGVDRFDHDFFGLAPRDALLMDPQHRLAIETAWNAVEAAGRRMDGLAGSRVGVFFASQVNEYAQLVPFEDQARAQMALGNVAALVANRISWLFDLRGPSEAVDTACSGALVAVHRAVQALRAGEAEMALAGGVSVMLSPDGEETVRKLGVGSPDHRCFVFDARANGYVKGEGVGAVLLKPLDRALADGDPVLAVIRGSAVGHGGHAQTLTAPNAAAQGEVIARAVGDAGIDPATIGYVEAHGTGTELGDPVEIEGLKQAFRTLGRGADAGACPVGSVKSNVGHLEPAAGIAGLAKVVMALRHRTIPASLHVETPNPLIDLADGLVRIAGRTEAWAPPQAGGPRRAGLSSFGFGGANAHLVLEEAPKSAPAAALAHPTLLVVSAADRGRLIARCEALAAHLAEVPVPVSALAATLMVGRMPLAERVAVRIAPGEDAAARMSAAVSVLRGGASDVGVIAGRAGDGAMAPGEATDALIAELLAEGALARIARLWVAGTAVDWATLGLAGGPRATLPAYPFNGPRCWFKGRPGAAAPAPSPVPAVETVAAPPPAAPPPPVEPAPVPAPFPAVVPTADTLAAADTIAGLVADALYVDADAIDRQAGLADLGLDSILAVELVQAINQTFATDLQAARLYDHPTVEALAAYVTGASPAPTPVSAAPSVSAPAAAPATPAPDNGAVFEEIRRIVADALYVDPDALDETAGFGDLGLDSILAVEVVQTINARWAIDLQAARLYDHPTVADLARHVAAAASGGSAQPGPAAPAAPVAVNGDAAPVLALLRERIGAALGKPAETIDPAGPLTGFPIDPETAAKILDEVAAATGFRPAFEQVGRCPDLTSLAAFLATGGAAQPVSAAPPPAPPPPAPPPPAGAPRPATASAASGDTVEAVRAAVAEVLDAEAGALGLETPLAELGVDLVQAGEIAYRLNRRFGADLKARRLMGFAGIAEIAAALGSGPPPDPGRGAKAQAAAPAPTISAPPPAPPPQPAGDNAVAIIGIAARYPGAGSTAAFWELIRDGRSAIGEVPAARWSVADNVAALSEPAQREAVRWGGFVEDVDRFDPLFFGLSPKEAEVMDPQQRLFLEEAWHALEDAGLTREALKGVACGVFVGGGQGDYVHLLPRDGAGLSGQMLLGNTTSILAARIAYFLDLKGPSLALDTACSSGLVATHYAVRSLLEGECEVALAGGVNLMLTPQMHLMTAASGMLAPDGKCKTFDDAADGFVPGEGLGVVVLKRLDKAVADGDRIYATILGSAVNQDGRTSSITAPSAASQARLEAGLYARAGIDARRIGLVEAHGTGTKLGDPIEISALAEAFAESGVADDGSARGSVAIGSVKTNIGHTLAAAGTAGLIKAALALRHATIPPSLHFTRPNGHIAFEDTPFRVATVQEAMDPARPLAVVSSFGFSGTNAHVVLAPPPAEPNVPDAAGARVFPLSAPSEAALRRLAGALADGLAEDARLDDIAHTLARRRSLFRTRALAVAADRTALIDALRQLASEAAPLGTPVGAEVPAALAADVASFLAGGAPSWDAVAPARVADLPGYPFDRRRFWIETAPTAAPPAPPASRVFADHPVLAGHVVAGRRLLPGVAALVLAQGGTAGWVAVSDLVWAAPVVPDEAGLDLALDRSGDGDFTLAGGAVRGRARPAEAPRDPVSTMPEGGVAVSAERIYSMLGAVGIAYGPEFRRIESVRVAGDAALVRFTAPVPTQPGPVDTAAVGVLDAALHALAAVSIARGDPAALLMPARLEAAWIGPDVARAAEARLSLRRDGARGTVAADADLLDAEGALVARLRGLHAAAPKNAAPGGAKTFLLQPRWVAEEAAGAEVDGAVAILPATAGAQAWAEALAADLRRAGHSVTVLGPDANPDGARTVVFAAFPDGAADIAEAERLGIHRLLDLAKHLIAAGTGCRLRVVTRASQCVGPEEVGDPSFASLSGFTRTLAREHPALDPVIVDLPAEEDETVAAARAHRALLLGERGGAEPLEVAYRGGRRFVRRLGELAVEDEGPGLALEDEGVVLILGGAGGIGRAVSLDLARRHRARLVWVGRRARNADIRAAIGGVEAAGGRARYVKADAVDAKALEWAIKSVEKDWGRIAGVIHATIVLADSRVETMDSATLDDALAAKSRTAVALDRALGDRRPDFLAVFSSSNALTCNPGQANYAAGCTFIDAWAEAWGRRTGVAVSVIDWGFWGETGIVARDDYRARAVAAGVDPMTTEEGLAIFRRLLGHRVGRAAVMRFAAAGRAQVEGDVIRVSAPPAAPALPNVLFREALSALDREPALDRDALHDAVGDVAAIEEYGRRRLARILGTLGALEVGTASIDEIAARAGVLPGYRRLLAALFGILARSGALVLRDGTVTVSDPPATDAPARPAVARLEAHLTLLETCLDGLTDVMCGRRRATDVMFPGGSSALVEAVYRDNPSSDPYNAILAATAGAMASAGGTLRVIEIGAGTGGATVAIVDALKAAGQPFAYTFTDVSAMFLDPARALFADTSEMSFAVLDLDADPRGQGFAAGDFDLVVASNVLHAAPDLARAVDHAKALLAPGGVLLLNEMTANSDLATLTFGLTEGWWGYRDPAERLAHGPLLDPDGWRGLLARAGFDAVAVGGLGAESGQSVVVARADGWMPWHRTARAEVAAPAAAPVGGSGPVDRAALIAALREIFAEAIKFDPSEIAADEPYEAYGVDSLVAMDIRAKLETRIGAFPTPLLFEGVTLTGLAEVLLREKPGEVAALTGAAPPSAAPVADAPAPAVATSRDAEPIAIVGMAGRYPGGESEAAFWRTLRSAAPVYRLVPADRWRSDDIPEPAARIAGLIDGVDRFDPLFFQIAPAEAAAMDPQERLFLETVWAAIEDAGTTPGRLGGAGRRVGVYAGAMRSDYQRIGTLDLAAGGSGLAGSSFWSIANRVSHQLDFRGPSVAVDTACSASLHAVHMAVEALRAGRVEAAVAGGVHLILHPQNQRAMAAMGLLSPTGRGRPFAADADGFVEGEGVGVVVLKRLSDAERDGDRVRAVILGGAVGSDGRSAGYMIPNPAAQADLIRGALEDARVAPGDVGYVEAQASGSPIGDPVEAAALTRVYREAGGARRLGTLKGVIGHLSAASGAAQLAKVVLQLEHGEVAPSAVHDAVHPDADISAFALSAAPAPWAEGGQPRIATITASGAGGASAVLVVAEAPPMPTLSVGGGAVAKVFPLSAKSPERLAEMARRLADHLEAGDAPLTAAAWTLQAGREAMAFRLAVVAEDRRTLVARLRAGADGEADGVLRGKANGHAPTPPQAGAGPEKLAEAWVRGAPVDWRAQWNGAVPRPVSLPTYPFERRRCWIETAIPAPVPAVKSALPAARRAVRIHRPADIDALAVEATPVEPPGADEVVIAVETFALNFGDLLSLRGSYPNLPPYPFTPGMEAVGRVVAVGAAVTGRRIGERVAAIAGGRGGQADHVTVPAALTVSVPEALDPVEAVALPIAYLTARHALDRADLAAGETVLITSAAGGVGPVLVQLAKTGGARVLATVGSAAKIPAIEALGAEVADYNAVDAASWVRERTSGVGADVIVNLLGGAAIQQGLDLLAPGGRYVEIALAGLMAAGRVDLSRLMDNQSLITVNLGRVLATPERTRAAMADLERALVESRLTPLVDSVHRFEDVAEAYRRMDGRESVGRIVVAVDPAIPSRAPVKRAVASAQAWPRVESPAPAVADHSLTTEILAVAAAVLGLAPNELTADRPMDEVGLTSVSGLEIARRLEGVVGRPVPVTLLWQHRSAGALAAVLSFDTPPVAAPEPRSPLVAIRTTGTTPPLFLVHGAPGEVSWAVDLAGRLGEDVPVYAFEAPGLHGDRAVPERVEDFAALYADLLENAVPAGAYVLGGYSGGGAIAFDVARVLAARGRPAAGLVLLDANAPGTDSLKGMEKAFGDGFIHRLAANWLASRWGGAMLDEEGNLDTETVVDHLFATAEVPMGRAELVTLIDGMDAVAGGIGRALAGYEAAAAAQPLAALLIRCRRGMAPADNPLGLPAFLTDGDYRAGWDRLVGGGIATVDVDCDHFSLVLEPHVDRVAAAIRDMLLPEPKAISDGNGRDRVAAVVLEKVREGLVDVPPEEVVAERSMTDLGATSLDRVEVTLAAMEALGLDIPPRDLVGLANIDALIDVLYRHLNDRDLRA